LTRSCVRLGVETGGGDAYRTGKCAELRKPLGGPQKRMTRLSFEPVGPQLQQDEPCQRDGGEREERFTLAGHEDADRDEAGEARASGGDQRRVRALRIRPDLSRGEQRESHEERSEYPDEVRERRSRDEHADDRRDSRKDDSHENGETKDIALE